MPAVLSVSLPSPGDGRLGILGQHGQRHGGLHPAVCGLPQDKAAPPSQEREAGGAAVQEMGGGRACDLVRPSSCSVHGEQLLPPFGEKAGGGGALRLHERLVCAPETLLGRLEEEEDPEVL